VLRVIARLNMGGPAHHVGLLGSRLDQGRYETLLLHGEVGSGEDSLEQSVRSMGVRMARVPGLGPELRPHNDLRALAGLVRAIRLTHPDIVHTHTAKAGMLGRLAAVLAGDPRPVIVHTYHGHVLEGYFGPVHEVAYRGLERRLAGVSDALIGVSEATVDDLVRLRVAPRSKFHVIPIGLDLDAFLSSNRNAGAAFRREVGVGADEVLLTFVGRLVPVKGLDLLLRSVARARAMGAPVRLAIVGDGQLRPDLERLSTELGVAARVHFLGYRQDMVSVAAAADVAVLTSHNEGTPVSLIEAAAAATPSVATAVGGVSDVVTPDTGLLVQPGDAEGLARAITTLVQDGSLRTRLGHQARTHVAAQFSARRLVGDIASLYAELSGKPKCLGPDRRTIVVGSASLGSSTSEQSTTRTGLRPGPTTTDRSRRRPSAT
jgi:glycosyltransferase involved in cell wall biosynthesis